MTLLNYIVCLVIIGVLIYAAGWLFGCGYGDGRLNRLTKMIKGFIKDGKDKT